MKKKNNYDLEDCRAIVQFLDSKKAFHITLLDISKFSALTESQAPAEYIIICNALSSVHVSALANELTRYLKLSFMAVRGVAGRDSKYWSVVDCNNLIINIFLDEVRKYYDIEGLWLNDSKSGAVEIDITPFLQSNDQCRDIS